MQTLDEYLANHIIKEDHDSDFLTYYFKLLNNKNLKDSEVYHSINMSRQTYNKIICGKMKPSLKTTVALAIGLKCSNSECKLLLKKFGYTLASSSLFALIIRYCLENKIYDYYKINELLIEKNQEPL